MLSKQFYRVFSIILVILGILLFTLPSILRLRVRIKEFISGGAMVYIVGLSFRASLEFEKIKKEIEAIKKGFNEGMRKDEDKLFKVLWDGIIVLAVLSLIFYCFTFTGKERLLGIVILFFISWLGVSIWFELAKIKKEIEAIKKGVSEGMMRKDKYKLFKLLWVILIVSGVLIYIFPYFTPEGIERLVLLGISLYLSGAALATWVRLMELKNAIEAIKSKIV